MFSQPPKETPWVSWLFVGLWTLVIYLTVPVARTLQRAVEGRTGGAEVFTWVAIAGVAVGVGLTLWRLLRAGRLRSGRRLAWLIAVAAVFIWRSLALRSAPVEALHFLEYGLLGVLLFRALAHGCRNHLIYVAAVLIGAVIGTVDEIVQWMVPERHWDLRDVGLNVLAVGLVQVAIAGAVRPAVLHGGIRRRSLRLVARLAALELGILALCFWNTPARVEAYTRAVPALDRLRGNPSVMTEYGHRHEHPEVGVFFSRLSLDELRAQDAARGPQAGAVLDRWKGRREYSEFLRIYRPEVDPFLHEARVHLFCRDRRVQRLWPQGLQAPMNPDMSAAERRRFCTTAFFENRIMELFFPSTLAHSSYVLPEDAIEKLRECADLDARYVSPVSDNLVTWISERKLPYLMLVLAGLCLGAAVALRSPRAPSPSGAGE